MLVKRTDYRYSGGRSECGVLDSPTLVLTVSAVRTRGMPKKRIGKINTIEKGYFTLRI